MVIFRTAATLQTFLLQQKIHSEKLGFVPTMGALHNGHISLINEALKENGLVVCSIFINPSQFNNQEDFAKYPVTIEKDIDLLVAAGCPVLFIPSRSEIYPARFVAKHYQLGMLERVLEGEYRPGHFQGVCQVVDRLLEIVSPDKLYLGQKDYQQCMVIKKLLELTGRTTELKIEPTVREANGLAMSSRNLRLNSEEREVASHIYKQLSWIKKQLDYLPVNELEREATSSLEHHGFIVDYVQIVDGDTLASPQKKENLVALVAAVLGGVRLIDNLILTEPSLPSMR